MKKVKKDTKRGTWYFVVDAPAVGGKRRQIMRRGFPTKSAAEKAQAQLIIDVGAGKVVRQTRETLGSFLLDTWLPARRDSLRESTAVGYEKVIRNRIVPRIGGVRLSALDIVTVEKFYSDLRHSGGGDGGALSPKTVGNVAGILSIALADAVRWKKIPENVAASARRPQRAHREGDAWTAEEASQFLDSVVDDRLFPLWRLALATGMRRGELCGLRWSDVDLDGGVVTIASTRVVAGRVVTSEPGAITGPKREPVPVVTGAPKTRSGERRVAIDPETVRALRSWKRGQAAERLAAGEAWADTGLVFVDQVGEPPHPETVTRWWREAVARSGVRYIRLHDARHTAATLLLRAGVPVKVVSQRLGHADVAVTMRVYQHATAQDDRVAADALAASLSRGH